MVPNRAKHHIYEFKVFFKKNPSDKYQRWQSITNSHWNPENWFEIYTLSLPFGQ